MATLLGRASKPAGTLKPGATVPSRVSAPLADIWYASTTGPATTMTRSLTGSKAAASAPFTLVAPPSLVRKLPALSVMVTLRLVVAPSAMPAEGVEIVSVAVSVASAVASSAITKLTLPLVCPAGMVMVLPVR